ncbi:MAG: hypothetical protein ACTS42_00775 [Candidatus Hodgkinia cicadicola]
MTLINVGWNFDCKISLSNKLKSQALFGGKISKEKFMRARGTQ